MECDGSHGSVADIARRRACGGVRVLGPCTNAPKSVRHPGVACRALNSEQGCRGTDLDALTPQDMPRLVLLALVAIALVLAAFLFSGQDGTREDDAQPTNLQGSSVLETSAPGDLPSDQMRHEVRAPILESSPGAPGLAPEPEALGEFRCRVLDLQGRPLPTAFVEFAGEGEVRPMVQPVSCTGQWRGELDPGCLRVRALPPRWALGRGPGRWQVVARSGAKPVELDLYLLPALGISIQGGLIDQDKNKLSGIEVLLRDSLTGRDQVTASDDRGAFEFLGVETGSYSIVLADGADDDLDQKYFVTESFRPKVVRVEPASPSVIQVGILELTIDSSRFLLFVHPPEGTDPASVRATVTSSIVSAGHVVPLARSKEGIVRWNPSPGDDDGTEQRLNVLFETTSGSRVYETQFLVEPGRTRRIRIPPQ